MMRIAVAGGAGLGPMIAQELGNAENAYNVVVLSRFQRDFPESNIQVIRVNYENKEDLAFALEGVDLVISTVTGPAQRNLILAASESQVRRFVPAEFEGKISKRQNPDPLLPYSHDARALLRRLENSPRCRMRYTVFSCGIFMERFHPYGLRYFDIGDSSGVHDCGDYLVDLNSYRASYVERNAQGHSVRICLTSMYDVAKFVAAAVGLGTDRWPHEYTMYGERMTMRDLVGTCSRFLNTAFNHQQNALENLQNYIYHSTQTNDHGAAAYYQRLLATATGRYDFEHPNLNGLVRVQPVRLEQWLTNVYTQMGQQ